MNSNDYSIVHWQNLPNLLDNQTNYNEIQSSDNFNVGGRKYVLYEKLETPSETTCRRTGMYIAGLLSVLTVIPAIILLLNKVFGSGEWVDQLINAAGKKKYYKKEFSRELSASIEKVENYISKKELCISNIQMHIRQVHKAFLKSDKYQAIASFRNELTYSPYKPEQCFYIDKDQSLKLLIPQTGKIEEDDGELAENCLAIDVEKT